MKKQLSLFIIIFLSIFNLRAQDTFSIVAVDTATGEVGSAGASCVDLLLFFPNYAIDFLGDLIPAVGAINSQASYLVANQTNARTRMLAGDTPSQIISWLVANDVQSNPAIRQYGIAAFVGDSVQTANHTGANCLNYKNHITGPTYCIQGNILLGQSVLDSMEARFLREPGDLACKLMAALQGAKVIGADTRCASNNSSSLFAFVKVSQPNDPYGSPSLSLGVKTPGGFNIEPIDSLQRIFDATRSCIATSTGTLDSKNAVTVFPVPASGAIRVRLSEEIPSGSGYVLYDFRNTPVLQGRVLEKEFTIVTDQLPAGNYQLVFSVSDKPATSRLVVIVK